MITDEKVVLELVGYVDLCLIFGARLHVVVWIFRIPLREGIVCRIGK
jgi:hypothetical protein